MIVRREEKVRDLLHTDTLALMITEAVWDLRTDTLALMITEAVWDLLTDTLALMMTNRLFLGSTGAVQGPLTDTPDLVCHVSLVVVRWQYREYNSSLFAPNIRSSSNCSNVQMMRQLLTCLLSYSVI